MITLVQDKTYYNVLLNSSEISAVIPHGSTAEIILKNGKTVEVQWGLYEYQKVIKDITRVDNPNYSESKLDEAIDVAIETLTEPINCVKCKHYGEDDEE